MPEAHHKKITSTAELVNYDSLNQNSVILNNVNTNQNILTKKASNISPFDLMKNQYLSQKSEVINKYSEFNSPNMDDIND